MIPVASSQTSEESSGQGNDTSEFYFKDYVMIFISVVSPIVSIIATWWISDLYHKKKNEPDEVFTQNRKDKIESLRQRTGHSYSIFKEQLEHIISKNIITKQDLVAFGSKDYSEIISALQHNRKNITDNWNEYLKWVTRDEILKYTDFFTHMLWFLRILQDKEFKEYDLQEANELSNKIKEISNEFNGISHIIDIGASIISEEDSKRLHGKKDFKSPV